MGLHSSIYPALFILTVLSIILSCHEPADKGISKLELAPEVNTEKVKPLSVDMSIQNNLIKTVNVLSEEIGSRDYLQSNALDRAVDYISSELRGYGYTVSYQPYEVQGKTYKNIFVEIKGVKTPEKILVVGAHYDTVAGTPGADDNASGIAGLLELARLLSDSPLSSTVQFAAFTLEEPPFFRTRHMGSYIYAGKLKKEGRNIEGMICLESIGYFTDTPGSQLFPLSLLKWIFPDKGNFIAFVSNLQSRDLLNRSKSAFKKESVLPVESLSTFSIVPGIDLSDHRSFWEFGYNAIMVTDTAFYRNPNYHGAGDTCDTIDYKRMTEVILGLKATIEELAQ